jgi:amino acid transporter
MILSLLVVSALYVLVVVVTSGVLGASQLDNSLTPVSDGASALMGRGGMVALSVAAVFAFVSTANAGIMAASRYLLALSRDGLLPWFFRKVNLRFRTPHVSIIFTGVFMITVLFLRLEMLVKAASTVLILTYIFSCLSVIIMRESRLQNYRPRFRAPFYPWTQIVGIVGLGVLIFEMGKEALAICATLAVGSFLVYWFYGRIKASRECAFLYLMERIVAKELRSHSMESELKEIIRERDDIITDRFDRVVERSIVMDIDETVQVDEFFKSVAEALSGRLKVEPSVLLKLLIERERESSTVISPGLAIPHVIVEGERTFDILLARCRKGIFFSERSPEVHAIFVLAGTSDERNFHLRTLSAIAQIAQGPDFERRFMAAEGKEGLRDCVLLAERRRDER